MCFVSSHLNKKIKKIKIKNQLKTDKLFKDLSFSYRRLTKETITYHRRRANQGDEEQNDHGIVNSSPGNSELVRAGI